MEEVWKDCYGYEEYLRVSSYGRVLGKGRWINNNGGKYYRDSKIKKQSVGGSGYYYTVLSVDGRVKNLRVNRLVLLTFNNVEGSEFLDVNHKDGKKLNNKLHNLEWMTRKENMIHAVKTGLIKTKTDEEKLKGNCLNCGNLFYKEREIYKYCSNVCKGKDMRLVERPSKEDLYKIMTKEKNFTSVGVMYGVSDNAIRKWCKNYGIPSSTKYYIGVTPTSKPR